MIELLRCPSGEPPGSPEPPPPVRFADGRFAPVIE